MCATVASPLLRPFEKQTAHSLRRVILLLFSMAILSMLVMSAIAPTVLLYMNHAHFTSATDAGPFATASALYTAGPILSHILLTRFAATYGHANALSIASLLAASGLLLILVLPASLPVFYVGYTVFSFCNSLRVVRVALLSKMVPTQSRTRVLALHSLMIPIGGLLGPLVWLAAQTVHDQLFIPLPIPTLTTRKGEFSVSVNRFSLDFLAATTGLALIAAIAHFGLKPMYTAWEEDENESKRELEENGQVEEGLELARDDGFQSDGDRDGDEQSTRSDSFENSPPVEVCLPSGRMVSIRLPTYRRIVFISFCLALSATGFSGGAYFTAIQPILVNVFHGSDSALGLLFEVVGILAIFPPLAVSFLSRVLADRQIMLIGLSVKLVGMCCYLGHDVPEWRVVAGFLLVVKASMFYFSTTMSLFTKLLGPMLTPEVMGIVMASYTAGMAVAQALSAPFVMTQFGTAIFGVYVLPAFVVTLVFISPPVWSCMTEENVGTKQILEEAERLKRRGFR